MTTKNEKSIYICEEEKQNFGDAINKAAPRATYNKKISVIITCYNYGKYIDEAIESVKTQTFNNYEIIIIDDCSSDRFTKEKIKEISKDNSIRLIRNETNIGVSLSRNCAAKEAKGEYVTFLDADDKLHPRYLQTMLKTAKNNNYDIIGSGYQLFGDDNSVIINKFDKFKICQEGQFPVSFLIKKDLFLKLGGFKENMKYGIEDHDFILNAIQNDCIIHIIPEVLSYIRKKEQSRHNDFAKSGRIAEMEAVMIGNNPKLFRWFIKEQESIIRKQKRKIKNLKNYLMGVSILSIIAIIAGLLI